MSVQTEALSEPCFVKEHCSNFKCEYHTEFVKCKQQETFNSSPLNTIQQIEACLRFTNQYLTFNITANPVKKRVLQSC